MSESQMSLHSRMSSVGFDRILLRVLCAALAFYFRRVPLTIGKLWVWDHIMRPHIIWRRLELVATTRFGVRIRGALPDSIMRSLYFFGVWEPAITACSSFLNPGDTVVDIGGNIGAHALLFSRLVGPEGAVHTIEASPSIYRQLAANLDANSADNITPYNMAVSDRTEQVTVFVHQDWNIGGTTIVPHQAANFPAGIQETVAASRLQDILPIEVIRAARLFKIDVEGAEWLVLQGMKELLPELSPDAEVLVELNAEALAGFGCGIADVVALFQNAGFSPFEIENEYGPQAYISEQRTDVRPLLKYDAPLVDVVMRRRQKLGT
jgi:FkbM family methyltransferase